MAFGKEFVWGVAASAYQIEGRAENDGKGEEIWDIFGKQPGKIKEGHTAEVACDHIHRYKEDIALMKQLGIRAYRFSMDWSRILPNGIGKVNEQGIAFYNDLIDCMLENEVEPYITLYHWELPYALYQKGGWLNPECIDWFGEYAKVVATYFSDRVTKFFTLNEPQCFVGLGCLTGEHAPGIKLPLRDTFEMAHNVLRANGNATRMLREYAKQPIEVGYAPTCGVAYPASSKPEDIEAARQCYFSCPDFERWTWNVSWWSDPVILGEYPEDGLRKYHAYLPKITKEDMKLIQQPLDFLGQNIYNGYQVKAGENSPWEFVNRKVGLSKTATNWPVTPECIYWGMKFQNDRYHIPMYVTENGISCHDTVSLDGEVHDPNRIDFLHRYLLQVDRAIQEGIDIRGYFEWTLLDNFEWNCGYTERFGMVYVDFETQQRIIKDSGYWYKDVINSNGANLIIK
ncbi:GH1 family beta-glucosidase [Anaerosporobacter faecicola]|uniref:GH1 family beta-glucosidase n=1 Tax=Anaerosporobacter faecicola TaxID=2718714 RepID=UPI00143C204A|nr:GH1 family beta-glucosidase [Anaerosporobacter faecicola]